MLLSYGAVDLFAKILRFKSVFIIVVIFTLVLKVSGKVGETSMTVSLAATLVKGVVIRNLSCQNVNETNIIGLRSSVSWADSLSHATFVDWTVA